MVDTKNAGADRSMQIRQKAKLAAKADGKEWATLSKDERRTFMDGVRGDLKTDVDARRAKRVAANSG